MSFFLVKVTTTTRPVLVMYVKCDPMIRLVALPAMLRRQGGILSGQIINRRIPGIYYAILETATII